MMKKDKYGNNCTKRLPIHIRTLALPNFNYSKAIEIAGKLFGSNGIFMDIRSEFCLALSEADAVKFNVIDGECKWNQFSSEQEDLYELAKISPGSGVAVCIVGGVKTSSGSLNGCAGHAPSKPAVVIGADATVYTLAHEIGHVLLGPSFSPVHTESTSNIMYKSTNGIPAGSSPTFNAEQATQIKKSGFLIAC